jgi:hypothetical protein
MFKLLHRFFGSRGKALRAAPVPARTSAPSARGPQAPANPAAAAVLEATTRPALDPKAAPELLCGLTPGMSTEEIRDHLAALYRRHNRAASSLDDSLRADAEIMLDAIVRCRESLLGVPASKPPQAP